jgi:hypothetical protein
MSAQFQSEKIKVDPGLFAEVEQYLKNHNLANRGIEDGDKRKQLVGLLGEVIVSRLLTKGATDVSSRHDGFDGGFDFIFKGYKIDVKTMERKSYVRPDYVNNFYLMQESYPSDIIVFCSYHAVNHDLEICGWIFKTELSKLGIFYPKGTRRIRTDGSGFTFRQDNYEIKNKDLKHINLLKLLDANVV